MFPTMLLYWNVVQIFILIKWSGYGRFPHQYHSTVQIKIQRRANTEKYEIKFTHIIKGVGWGNGNGELNQWTLKLLQYLCGALTVIPAVQSGKSTDEFHMVRCFIFC
jgi:hypothetical protein